MLKKKKKNKNKEVIPVVFGLNLVEYTHKNEYQKFKNLIEEYIDKNDKYNLNGKSSDVLSTEDFKNKINTCYKIACKNGYEEIALYIVKNKKLYLQKEKGLQLALNSPNPKMAFEIYENLEDGPFHLLDSGYFSYICNNNYIEEVKKVYDADFFKIDRALQYVYEIMNTAISNNNIELLELLLSHKKINKINHQYKEENNSIVTFHIKNLYHSSIKNGIFKMFDDFMELTLSETIEWIKEIKSTKYGYKYEFLIHVVEKFDISIQETLIEQYLNKPPEVKNTIEAYLLNKKLKNDLPQKTDVKKNKI